MLCEICQQNQASVHLSRKTVRGGVTLKKHYCESCVQQLGLLEESGASLVLFPWEEQGEGSFSVTGHISRVASNVVVLRVLRCSHYPPGSELVIRASLVPEPMRRVGSQFSFNLPVEKISLVLIEG